MQYFLSIVFLSWSLGAVALTPNKAYRFHGTLSSDLRQVPALETLDAEGAQTKLELKTKKKVASSLINLRGKFVQLEARVLHKKGRVFVVEPLSVALAAKPGPLALLKDFKAVPKR